MNNDYNKKSYNWKYKNVVHILSRKPQKAFKGDIKTKKKAGTSKTEES